MAVDVQATTAAFERLFESAELRHQMGDAGRKRAREVFDWKIIIGLYEDLWAKLAEIRASQAKDLETLAHPWPARMDPFYAFGSYPSAALTLETVLALADSDIENTLLRASSLRGLAMVGFATQVLPTDAEMVAVIGAVAAGQGDAKVGAINTLGVSVATLIANIPAPRQAYVLRSLNWLLKLGILEVSSLRGKS